MVVEKTDADNKPVWSIGGIVEGVNPSGKDIVLVVEPIDTYSYHAIALEFHLNYKVAEQMKVDYEINGKNVYNTFQEAKTKFLDFLADIVIINRYYVKEGMPVNYQSPLWDDARE